MARYPMTLGGFALGATLLVVPVALGVPLLLARVAGQLPPPGAVAVVVLSAIVPITLLVAGVLSPSAVRVDAAGIAVERRMWRPFAIPWADVAKVTEGPPIEVLGRVHRVAGNGGLLGFSGLYRVDGVGLVRLFATRLGRPTVVVHRRTGMPVVLGVDTPAELLSALAARVHVPG